MTNAKVTLAGAPPSFVNIQATSTPQMSASVNANGDLIFTDDSGRGIFAIAKGQWTQFQSDEVNITTTTSA